MSLIEKGDNRPFFIYLNYTVPHAELRVPDDSMAPFKGHFPEKPFVNAAADAKQTGPDEPSLGYRSQPTPHAAFAAMVSRMDRDVGRIVDLLRARGLDQNTLVLFTSDNGPHQEGGADPEFFKARAGFVNRACRRRHSCADDCQLARHDCGRHVYDLCGRALGSVPDVCRACGRPFRGSRRHVYRSHAPRTPAPARLYAGSSTSGFQQAVRWEAGAVRLAKDKPLELQPC
jgi:arylsulfatase A-like enzyme